ncbi:MAG: DUF4382 domain-containing protein [Promethearchaeota archaeon]
MVSKKVPVLLMIGCLCTVGILCVTYLLNQKPLEISIKDAPLDELVSINVDIAALQVQKEDQVNWITLMEGSRQLNCSVSGEQETICRSDISPGTYNIMRIKMNNIKLRFNNNSLYEVNKYENQNMVQNQWYEFNINFTYDGTGGKILLDITINNDLEANIIIIQATS